MKKKKKEKRGSIRPIGSFAGASAFFRNHIRRRIPRATAPGYNHPPGKPRQDESGLVSDAGEDVLVWVSKHAKKKSKTAPEHGQERLRPEEIQLRKPGFYRKWGFS